MAIASEIITDESWIMIKTVKTGKNFGISSSNSAKSISFIWECQQVELTPVWGMELQAL